jgi:hypothetical protein
MYDDQIEGKTMRKLQIRAILVTLFVTAAVAPLTAGAQPLVTGLQGAAGSTVGPGGDIFVTEGLIGRVSRVDPRTGTVSTFAEGLPPSVIGVGGAVDVAFIGDTGYVLVTLVSLFSPAFDGVYRIDGPNSFTLIADLGAYSAANPPATPFDLPTGVQWSIEAYRGGLLVSDGHHNRVLWVSRDGDISEFRTFGNVVPTGLDVSGNTVYLALAGPVPHTDSEVVTFGPKSDSVHVEASGAPLILDVEFGRGRSLFALSQGEWNGQAPGSPAIPFDGALWEINTDGSLRLVEDNINLPNSVEIIRNDAYVVTLAGDILRIENIAGPPFGK